MIYLNQGAKMKEKLYDRTKSLRDNVKALSHTVNDIRYQAIQENNTTLVELLEQLSDSLEKCSLVSINSVKLIEADIPERKTFMPKIF